MRGRIKKISSLAAICLVVAIIASTTVAMAEDKTSIGEAVDNTGLNWYTDSEMRTPWYGQFTTYYYGGDAARSSPIGDGGNSWMSTKVDAPGYGILSFYWTVSSEPGYDYLVFYIDGVPKGSISGYDTNTGGYKPWEFKSYRIDAGTHWLTWEYKKDGSVSKGKDAGLVDKVVWATRLNR